MDKRELIKKEIKDELSKEIYGRGKEEHNKYLKFVDKKKKLEKEDYNDKKEVLGKHYNLMIKAKSIENLLSNGKSNLVEKNLICQMDSIKSIFDFYKELDVCKSQSLIKISPDKKRMLYIQLKRKEQEEKERKEDEEKRKLEKH